MSKKNVSSRFKLTLEYEGTSYSGWQKQNDAKTIQGVLLQAAAGIFGREVDIQGSGRTDAGVHALNYVAHLEAKTELSALAIMEKFNDILPKDIVILEVERVQPRFHARHDCVGRSYLYRISKRKTAFSKKHVWWVKDRLDFQAMQEAARLFVGMHDFVSFAEKQELKKSTKVLVNAIELLEEDEVILFRIVGSHFLWKMVRRLVGVLVEVGRHNLSVQDISQLLREQSDRPAQYTAPPAGLFFEQAFYDPEEFQVFLESIPGSIAGPGGQGTRGK